MTPNVQMNSGMPMDNHSKLAGVRAVNNSIAQAELQLTDFLDNEIRAVCRIPHTPALAEITAEANGHSANVFTLPSRIDAHQTAAGWLVFSLGNNILAGRTIDTYRIILEDSHGASTTTEPILVKDWSSYETPKN